MMTNVKPEWKKAPKWAKWLAQDKNGEWRWYETKPHIDLNANDGAWIGGEKVMMYEPVIKDWSETLEPRPEEAE